MNVYAKKQLNIEHGEKWQITHYLSTRYVFNWRLNGAPFVRTVCAICPDKRRTGEKGVWAMRLHAESVGYGSKQKGPRKGCPRAEKSQAVRGSSPVSSYQHRVQKRRRRRSAGVNSAEAASFETSSFCSSSSLSHERILGEPQRGHILSELKRSIVFLRLRDFSLVF